MLTTEKIYKAGKTGEAVNDLDAKRVITRASQFHCGKGCTSNDPWAIGIYLPDPALEALDCRQTNSELSTCVGNLVGLEYNPKPIELVVRSTG